MASKLNLGIKEAYDRAKKTGAKVEDAASSLKGDVEAKVISVQKSKVPFFSKFKTRSSEFLKDHKVDSKYLLLAIPIIAVFLIAAIIQNGQTIGLQAGTHQASVSFQLTSWDLPPQNTFGVWVNSDSPVAFSDIELSFDPKLVRLTSEVALKDSLTRNIKVTSMAEANTTGRISIVLGLDPSKASNPPLGVFQIADLTFNSNTTSKDVSTKIAFMSAGMQIVAIDQSVFSLTTTGVDLNINKTATPTPTATLTATPVATPTPRLAPTPTPSLAPAPTLTPVPTATPIPQGKVLLSGTVTNSRNHNLIRGISITVRDIWGKTVAKGKTNTNGHYGFYLATGTYKVTASGFGYASQTATVNLSTNTIVNFAISRWKVLNW